MTLVVACAVVLPLPCLAQAEEFADITQEARPLRPFYPSIRTLETEDLLRIYPGAVIVDVRTAFEVGVIRIAKAVNISLAEGGMVQSLARYRLPESTAPLVFYCNDASCSRAFRAALAAQAAGYGNVFVYDAGVFTWLGSQPDKTVLMGASPARPRQVVPPEAFEKHRCGFEEFQRRAAEPAALVVDIRNIYNRDRLPRVPGVHAIPMESFMDAVINRVWAEKELLIFDARGVQTRWLQFFLQANGYVDYVFLKGGMEALDVGTQSVDVAVDTSGVNVSQHQLLELTADTALETFDRRALHLLMGFMVRENYALVDRQQAALMLDCSETELVRSAARLKQRGYILYSRQGDNLVVHVSPRLAWKGAMEGELWRNRVREFDRSGGR